ncbi:Kinesin-like protein klpA [Escovopsis weberi]|uniref:Kinesin-like protein n=1 Tax=Escovopsis weberi TaxID=150374 RepID=A0A0M8N1N2_ESCWE|nr:Kinesin-like protein klpA [Escovopsis weberi]
MSLIRAARTIKASRLPGPTTVTLGEWSDSQHNARVQSSIPAPPGLKGTKREIPQPAVQSEPKRKPLSQRAGEYPPKPSAAASGPAYNTRSSVRGQTLAGISQSQLRAPSRQLTGPNATTTNTIGLSKSKSFNGGRNNSTTDPSLSSLSARSVHARSKSQGPRPGSVVGQRNKNGERNEPKRTAFDVDKRVGNVESQFHELKHMVDTTLNNRKGMDEMLELAKKRVAELEKDKTKFEDKSERLRSELDQSRDDVRQLRHDMEKMEWDHSRETEELKRQHRVNIDDLNRQHRTAMDDLTRDLDRLKTEEASEHRQRIDFVTRRYQQELDDERQKRELETQQFESRLENERMTMEIALHKKDMEIREVSAEAQALRTDLHRQKGLHGTLQANYSDLSASNTSLEAKISSLRSQVEFLESDTKAQSDAFTDMEARLQEAVRIAEESRQKLIKEETERRVLFNKYQELKGNIRVMCRVRPAIDSGEGQVAGMTYPDEKTSAEIVVAGPEEKSSLGAVQRKNYPFEFDRVFMPNVQNEEIFDEISQLVQSALDGYNVCIFCYGQTGSGKTYTMSSRDGMIPRATHMIYDTITKLKEKSWEYTMEGSFVEVYNEELNDLLTANDKNAKKLEIRHDDTRKQTTITNCKSVRLSSADTVETMLEQAQKNRSVAATKANERSSRSHSIFILKLIGHNSATGERCEGTLNLVDLAGSERLKHSQVEGDRMRETQNINKSLSCLGDVIEALGKNSGHVPYRNSKLTHLLQYSLGGNSKTLMFVMVSPLETHLKETLTSLRFATKVYNTHVGTATATTTKKVKGQ